MAWYGSGEDRIKRFRLYQELENKYTEALKSVNESSEHVGVLLARLAEREGELARAQATIKALASELAGMATNKEEEPSVCQTPPVTRLTTRPPPKKSGSLPLKDVLAELEAKRRIA